MKPVFSSLNPYVSIHTTLKKRGITNAMNQHPYNLHCSIVTKSVALQSCIPLWSWEQEQASFIDIVVYILAVVLLILVISKGAKIFAARCTEFLFEDRPKEER